MVSVDHDLATLERIRDLVLRARGLEQENRSLRRRIASMHEAANREGYSLAEDADGEYAMQVMGGQ